MDYGEITWGVEKAQLLRETRGVSFEDVEAAIEQGDVLADIPHPSGEQYGHQRILIVLIEGYTFNVPYVMSEEGIFLKTMFPSRRSKKLFSKQGDDDER